MKILHVIPNFSAIGGAEMMLSRLILALPQHQHNVVALIHDIDDTFAQAVAQCEWTQSLHWNGVNTAKTVWQLRKIIQKYQPDVVQSWLYHANVLAAFSLLGLKNKPKLCWGIHHSLASWHEESRNTKIAITMSKYLASQADAIVYCAQSALQQHQALGFNNPQQVYIANGLVVDNFAVYPQGHQPCTVGFAGRYHPAKGYSYLFELIGQCKDLPIHFKIAGRGANFDNPDIQQWITQYQIDESKMTLLDQVSDMPAFYQSIDVLLMTSITEGFPNVLVEAMASGVPCIATDVGDSRAIIADSGWVVPSRDVAALRQALLQYLEQTDEQKLLQKQQVRQRVEQNFDMAHISRQYERLWHS